ERERRIDRRTPKSAVPFSLEDEHLRRQHAPPRQRRPRLFRHSAEVFANDERPMSDALEGENSKQVVAWIADARAVRRRAAVRDPEQSEETEHMIDAQRAGVAEGAAQRVYEIPVAISSERAWIDRRESPMLSGCGVRIWRSADGRATREQVGEAPRVGAPGGHANRQILVQADPHSPAASPLAAAA